MPNVFTTVPHVLACLLRGTENLDRDRDRGRKCSEPGEMPLFGVRAFNSFGHLGAFSVSSGQPQTTYRYRPSYPDHRIRSITHNSVGKIADRRNARVPSPV
jgi:hypothetical protein